jgi:hypothetical protein
MALNISALKAEAEAVVNEATSIVDLADKWAQRVRPLLVDVPTVGPYADTLITVLDDLDKVLHEAKTVLNAL